MRRPWPRYCGDTLGMPPETFTIFHGGTNMMPFGVGTFGSRGTVMAGNAVRLACLKLRDKALAIASRYIELEATTLVFRRGQVYRQGAEDHALLGLDHLVRLSGPASPYNLEEPGLEATAYFKSNQLTYTYGTHVAHIAVDPETGKIEILRYVVVEDIGRCINPLIVHGQTVGAAVQGIGATILEELVYSDHGQLLSGTLMDYTLPTSTDAPAIDSIILEEAPSLNPLGVKGAGEEGGIVATGAALANAVSHALASLGIQVTELPLSPDRIRRWIRASTTQAL